MSLINRLIVLEGPSGCGKSTINKALSTKLESLGNVVYSTREPSDKFNRSNENTMSGFSLYELFLADRVDHVRDEILPALLRGEFVICDRYIPSTLTYQCIEGVDFEKVYSDNSQFIIPGLTVFLEVAIAQLVKRVAARDTTTRFEQSEFRIREVEQYGIVKQRLEHEKGWNIQTINNDIYSVDDVVEMIINRINA